MSGGVITETFILPLEAVLKLFSTNTEYNPESLASAMDILREEPVAPEIDLPFLNH